MVIESIQVNKALLTLLQSCGLQSSDIDAGQHINFFGIYSDGALQATVGIEPLEGCALLRSLSVAKSVRRLGYAQKLVKHAEISVQKQGLNKLYLLTDTAASYFAKHGYVISDRAVAPRAIKQTAQFSTLCAQSSSLLFKAL